MAIDPAAANPEQTQSVLSELQSAGLREVNPWLLAMYLNQYITDQQGRGVTPSPQLIAAQEALQRMMQGKQRPGAQGQQGGISGTDIAEKGIGAAEKLSDPNSAPRKMMAQLGIGEGTPETRQFPTQTGAEQFATQRLGEISPGISALIGAGMNPSEIQTLTGAFGTPANADINAILSGTGAGSIQDLQDLIRDFHLESTPGALGGATSGAGGVLPALGAAAPWLGALGGMFGLGTSIQSKNPVGIAQGLYGAYQGAQPLINQFGGNLPNLSPITGGGGMMGIGSEAAGVGSSGAGIAAGASPAAIDAAATAAGAGSEAATAGASLGTGMGTMGTLGASVLSLPVTAMVGAMLMNYMNTMEKEQAQAAAQAKETHGIQKDFATALPTAEQDARSAVKDYMGGNYPRSLEEARIAESQGPALSRYYSTRGGQQHGIFHTQGDPTAEQNYGPRTDLDAAMASLASIGSLDKISPEAYSKIDPNYNTAGFFTPLSMSQWLQSGYLPPTPSGANAFISAVPTTYADKAVSGQPFNLYGGPYSLPGGSEDVTGTQVTGTANPVAPDIWEQIITPEQTRYDYQFPKGREQFFLGGKYLQPTAPGQATTDISEIFNAISPGGGSSWLNQLLANMGNLPTPTPFSSGSITMPSGGGGVSGGGISGGLRSGGESDPEKGILGAAISPEGKGLAPQTTSSTLKPISTLDDLMAQAQAMMSTGA